MFKFTPTSRALSALIVGMIASNTSLAAAIETIHFPDMYFPQQGDGGGAGAYSFTVGTIEDHWAEKLDSWVTQDVVLPSDAGTLTQLRIGQIFFGQTYVVVNGHEAPMSGRYTYADFSWAIYDLKDIAVGINVHIEVRPAKDDPFGGASLMTAPALTGFSNAIQYGSNQLFGNPANIRIDKLAAPLMFSLEFQAMPVPEPSQWGMFAIGLAAIGGYAWKERRPAPRKGNA